MKQNFPFNLKSFAIITTVLLVTGLFALFGIQRVSAEIKNQVNLQPPDFSAFPNININFWVFDGAGKFVKNLQASDLHVIENDQVLVVDKVELLEPGVQFIVAVNEAPTLANRYSMVSRIDRIKDAITQWAQSQPVTSMDQVTLINNSGQIAVNLNSPSAWIKAVDAYKPDLLKAKPGLSSLSSAIDFALAADPKMTPAILYITPLPAEGELPGLKDLFSKIAGSKIRLYIWLYGPQTYAASREADVLRQAAEQNNGQFVIFSGSEPLPDLAGYLDPLTYLYQLTYHSNLKTTGDVTLQVQVHQNELSLESEKTSASIKVEPPNPIFLTPPSTVTRSWTVTKKKSDSVLAPDTVDIPFMTEFTDGHQRDIVSSQLFVDGTMVNEITGAPFEKFTWSIKDITTSGSHNLKIVVRDSAGLKGETIEIPVEIVVNEQTKNWLEKIVAKLTVQGIVLFSVIAVTGLFLVLVTIRSINKNRQSGKQKTHRVTDPVTQPVKIPGEELKPARGSEKKIEWPRIAGLGPAPARLLAQTETVDQKVVKAEIPLSGEETLIGSNPKKVEVVLAAPLINEIHARIYRDENAVFHVNDMGSSAGTWLNYAPVSSRGAKLEHGDLVQFGRLAYRFEELGGISKKLKIEPYEGEE